MASPLEVISAIGTTLAACAAALVLFKVAFSAGGAVEKQSELDRRVQAVESWKEQVKPLVEHSIPRSGKDRREGLPDRRTAADRRLIRGSGGRNGVDRQDEPWFSPAEK